MSFYTRIARLTNRRRTLPEHTSGKEASTLPAALRKRDLALFIILITVIISDIRGMKFSGTAAYFYWLLALITFQVPCIAVFGWLTLQAPKHVPVYVWILRLVSERWRSIFLFLMWWTGVLAVLSMLGICLSLLNHHFPALFGSLPAQSLAFAVLLILATLFTSLPVRTFRIVLWLGALFYLAFFTLLVSTALYELISGHAASGVFPSSLSSGLPGQFSWPLFGLAVLSLFGLNGSLLLDGEMRGKDRFLRNTTVYLWWGGLGSFLILLFSTISWLALKPERNYLYQAISQSQGSGAGALAWLLLLLGIFSCALAYFFVFSRAFLLAAHLGYLPRSLARLNRVGTPLRAFLAQSAMIACAAVLLLILTPALLKTWLPASLFNDLLTGDQFGLLTSIVGSLWCSLTALMFIFALWLCWKKRHRTLRSWNQRLFLPPMCLVGILSSLACAFAPLLPDWPALFFSRNRWFPLVLLGVTCSLVLAWVISELWRHEALLREKEKHLAQEKALRLELQQSYMKVNELHTQLQETAEKQQISILWQKLLLDEINQLYREQEQAAITDPVTGLLNHRAFIQRLDEEIKRAQNQKSSFLLFFLDLDYFKVINDSWGHLAGDAVLHEVAQRLRQALRPRDVLGRYGGEEFALMMVGATVSDARTLGERLCGIINATPYSWRPTEENTTGIKVTASIGVAAYGVHGAQREELIEKADLAMYQAKLDGRNCVRIAGTLAAACLLTARLSSQGKTRSLARDAKGKTSISAQALRALAAMIQARDCSTGAHSQRVIWLAEATGHFLHASPEELVLMRLGGLLHDVGKIGIPDAILNKAGSLTEEEWETMRRHPVIGAHILEHMGGFFQRLAPIVQSHHERWDGHGYPQGLHGTEIPLASRVLSVVDAYDAMISRRSYKDPMPPSAAEAELRHNAGTQFDPNVVQAFLTMLKTPAACEIDPDADLDWDSLIHGSQNLLEASAR